MFKVLCIFVTEIVELHISITNKVKHKLNIKG